MAGQSFITLNWPHCKICKLAFRLSGSLLAMMASHNALDQNRVLLLGEKPTQPIQPPNKKF